MAAEPDNKNAVAIPTKPSLRMTALPSSSNRAIPREDQWSTRHVWTAPRMQGFF
jgi:hypothetical protein